jgi:signal transduction histidine kinase
VAEVFRDEEGNVEKVHGTVQDVTDRKRAEMEIRHSRDRLRELTAQIDQVREEERLALAREIHDEVGQNLTAMRMDLASLEAELPEGWEGVANRIRSLIDISQDSVDRLNRLSSELRSPVLDLLGLEDAVDTVVWEYRDRWGMNLVLSLDLEGYTGDPERDLTAFRVIKEALTNVAKHAQATLTEVKLHTEEDTLRMEVMDDGVGIPPDGPAGSRSFGIMGMRERVERLGGSLTVSPRPEGGTHLQAEIPLHT